MRFYTHRDIKSQYKSAWLEHCAPIDTLYNTYITFHSKLKNKVLFSLFQQRTSLHFAETQLIANICTKISKKLWFFCYMTLYGLARGGMTVFFIFCPTSIHKSEIRWHTLKLTFATESKGKRYWLVCLRIVIWVCVICAMCIRLH